MSATTDVVALASTVGDCGRSDERAWLGRSVSNRGWAPPLFDNE